MLLLCFPPSDEMWQVGRGGPVQRTTAALSRRKRRWERSRRLVEEEVGSQQVLIRSMRLFALFWVWTSNSYSGFEVTEPNTALDATNFLSLKTHCVSQIASNSVSSCTFVNKIISNVNPWCYCMRKNKQTSSVFLHVLVLHFQDFWSVGRLVYSVTSVSTVVKFVLDTISRRSKDNSDSHYSVSKNSVLSCDWLRQYGRWLYRFVRKDYFDCWWIFCNSWKLVPNYL